jgi:D-amino-acid dehydrogenase
MNVTFLYDTQIQEITVTNDDNQRQPNNKQRQRITQLRTNQGVIPIPDDVQVVVAAGAWTPRILAYMDLYVPVYPLKGYAMSVSASEALALASSSTNKSITLQPSDLPSRIVSDEYMFTTRLGSDEIRITSIGEFSGWDTKPTPHVDVAFRQEAKRQFPQLADAIDRAVTRCGHRPFVNDGILLLGAVDTHHNLYVSCGPGSNGWKLCIGSGEILNRIMAGETPQQIQKEFGFDVTPFSPSGRVLYAPWFTKLCRARWNWF